MRGSAARIVVTVGVTLLIVAAEFALLTAIYQRAAPVRTQRVIAAELLGQLQVAGSTPDQASRVAADTEAAADRLSAAGLSRSRLTALRSAASDLAAARSDVGPALDALRQDAGRLGDQLAARQRELDGQARIGYVMLLVAASLGWAVWFRKLVSRHRSLQAQITEQVARTAGELRLAALVRNSSDVIAVCDLGGEISFVTPSVHQLLGVQADDLLGTAWLDRVVAEDREPFLLALGLVRPGEDAPLRARMTHADGRVLDVEGSVTNLLADDSVAGLVVTVRDITARVALERQLTHQAFHDALTGLANRQLFGDRLEHALVRRSSVERPLVVLFCDLDEFKNVNDSLGHAAGDQVLVEVARRSSTVIRTGDTLARLGGDEFAVLMEDADVDAAEEVAERLQAAISEPIAVEGRLLSVRASIGLARAVPGEMSADEALRNADVAMYLAKSRGKGTVAHYESRLHAESLERLALRADLQRGIRDGELRLHFQPTIDLRLGGVAGFEALVRWEHPTRGLIPPLLFVPMAEESGLIRALGSWVLRAACAAAVQLNAARPSGSRPLPVAVNVGAQQLADPGFVNEVLQVLTDVGLHPSRLTLEITESVVLQDLSVVVSRLAALRDRGIRIAIDDFGTGYSSLAYLRNLPVDILKIDKSFIDHVTTEAQDAALTEGILAMSTGMNLTTVAEGVEVAAQAQWLSTAHCVYGQGFLWSRPVPLTDAIALLSGPLKPADLDATEATDGYRKLSITT